MPIFRQLFGTRWRRRLIISLLVLTLLLVTAITFNHWASQSHQVAVYVEPSAKASTTLSTTDQTLNTAYFSTKLPSNYRVEITTPANSQGLVSLLALSKATDEQLGIICDQLPAGGLSQVSSYSLRASQPTSYLALSSASSGLPSGDQAFASTTDSSIAVFITHDDRYVSITASDAANSDLLSLLHTVINQWSWH